jgi:hypothetical protein
MRQALHKKAFKMKASVHLLGRVYEDQYLYRLEVLLTGTGTGTGFLPPPTKIANSSLRLMSHVILEMK